MDLVPVDTRPLSSFLGLGVLGEEPNRKAMFTYRLQHAPPRPLLCSSDLTVQSGAFGLPFTMLLTEKVSIIASHYMVFLTTNDGRVRSNCQLDLFFHPSTSPLTFYNDLTLSCSQSTISWSVEICLIKDLS